MTPDPSARNGAVAAAQQREVVTPYAAAILALCVLVGMTEGYDVQAMALAAPLVRTAWHLTFGQIGLLLAMSAIGLVLGSFLLSPLGDILGRRPAILLGLLMAAIGTGSGMLAEGVNSLLGTRLVAGIGLGLALPNVLAIATEFMPLRVRTIAVVLVSCGYPLGAALGSALVSALVPTLGHAAVFLVGGTGTAGALVLCAALLPESPAFLSRLPSRAAELSRLTSRLGYRVSTDARPDRNDSRRGALFRINALFSSERRLATILLWMMNLGNVALVYFYFSWLPSLFVGGDLDASAAIRATALFSASGAVGGLAMALLLPRLGSVRVLTGAYVIATLGTVGLATRENVDGLLYLILAVSGAAVVGSQFCLSAVVVQYYPSEIRATASGYATGIGRAGAILTPLAAGAIIALMGGASRYAFLIAIVPALIALFAAIALELTGALRRGI